MTERCPTFRYVDVVCVSGWAQTNDAFAPLANSLSDIASVYCTSVGELYHRSEVLVDTDTDLSVYAHHLRSFLSNFTSPPILVGWSMGGQVALELLTRHTDVACKLVLFNSTARFTQSEEYSEGIPEEYLETLRADLKHKPKTAIRRFNRLMFSNSFSLEGSRRRRVDESLQFGVSCLDHGLNYMHTLDLRSSCCNVVIPSLVIHGTEDMIIPYLCGQRLAASLPDSRFVCVEGGSHGLVIEKFELIEQELRGFLCD